MATPVIYADAVPLVQGIRIPWPLEALLKRTGPLISPAELEKQARNWRRCPKCRDVGLLGNAIDGDLQFCDCPAGEERPHRDGADWPEQEIARVHENTQSLLTAAFYELGKGFVGDAVAKAQVRDSGQILEIIPTPWDARTGMINTCNVKCALERIGLKRSLVIVQSADQRCGESAIASAAS